MMRIPSNPFDLVVPRNPDFRFGGWELVFGRYQWFYVAGAQLLLAKAGLSDYSAPQKKIGQIKAPSDWQLQCPSLDWESIAANQVQRAVRTKLQRFDKALLSVLAIIKAVEEDGKTEFAKSLSEKDPINFIQVKPATFEIDNFEKKVFPELDDDKKRDLLMVSKQIKEEFLHEIARGHGATYPTLSAMITRLHGSSVRPKVGRSSGALGAASSENVIISQDI